MYFAMLQLIHMIYITHKCSDKRNLKVGLLYISGCGGLEVEQWSDNRFLSPSAVRIPLGTIIYMVP